MSLKHELILTLTNIFLKKKPKHLNTNFCMFCTRFFLPGHKSISLVVIFQSGKLVFADFHEVQKCVTANLFVPIIEKPHPVKLSSLIFLPG